MVAAIFERAGDRILASDRLLDLIGATEAERSLWSIDPGYSGFTLSSRLDSFMVGEDARFVEYNAESPAGIGYTDCLSEVFTDLPAMAEWDGRETVQRFHGRRELLETLLWASRQRGTGGTPSIAIIDWAHVVTRRDFELCAAYFRDSGVPTVVVDPRRLEYRQGRLWSGDQPITIVYRRVLLHELLAKADECGPLLQAYRDGAFCMVNSPRSKILHKKAVMALLDDPGFGLELSEEERSVLTASIPWTRLLQPGETTYRDRRVELTSFVREERERLVLKPFDDYGGRGVVLGWETDEDEWDRAIEKGLGADYVVQERVPVPEAEFPVWEGGRVELVPLLLDTDPLLFRGRVGSVLTRLSGTALLNVSAGAGSTTTTFVLKEKGA